MLFEGETLQFVITIAFCCCNTEQGCFGLGVRFMRWLFHKNCVRFGGSWLWISCHLDSGDHSENEASRIIVNTASTSSVNWQGRTWFKEPFSGVFSSKGNHGPVVLGGFSGGLVDFHKPIFSWISGLVWRVQGTHVVVGFNFISALLGWVCCFCLKLKQHRKKLKTCHWQKGCWETWPFGDWHLYLFDIEAGIGTSYIPLKPHFGSGLLSGSHKSVGC